MGEVLKFEPFSSAGEVSFWKELAHRKINVWKLSDEPREIRGYYGAPTRSNIPARFSVSSESFVDTDKASERPVQSQHAGDASAPGLLHNKNTKEDFISADKNALLQQTALQIWADIESGAALQNPALLARFALLTFADLKKHNFVYWFCFPALVPKQLFCLSCPPSPLPDFLAASARLSLWRGIQAVQASYGATMPCIVLLD